MAQVTLYIDKETADRLKRAANQSGMSRSRWVANLIQRRTAAEWPQAVKDLAGAWSDLPAAKGLRRHIGRDTRRERF